MEIATQAKYEKGESTYDRWIDLASVLLLSAATVLTAWAGYQSARWTAVQTRQYNLASADRVAASVAAARMNTLQTADLVMFLQFIAAVAQQRNDEALFIKQRFRPEMKRAVDAWLLTKPRTNKAAPSSPFAMPQYHVELSREVDRLNAVADETFKAATLANEIADSFVRLTVIFAAVSFLGGMSTKFRFPFHLIVIAAGFLTLAFGIVQIFVLPLQ